ncbi:sugar phosphate isomerase/epimerase family protein [Paenibacillus sp. TAF43_2]|uniref:sugar phosphate isomerase/epimerase family protein n=1 Tax=Paenibacillus sp. TAF43_2 TaxID=3233069 RepID=UPI003F970115
MSKNSLQPSPVRLEVQQAWWSMIGLGNGSREWTVEEKFEQIAKAGFTGIFGGIPAKEEREKWRRLLDDYDFSFGTGGFPGSASDLRVLLEEAKEFGAQYVNSQVVDSFVTGDAALRLLTELDEEAHRFSVPHFVETHRGRITQDLLRTAGYVEALPGLRLTIDFSHYIIGGEMDGFLPQYEEKAEPLFDLLLQRTSCIHARLSNGQQIQVSVQNEPLLDRFSKWWSKGMQYWLEEAKPLDGSGSDGAFPFVCELGPSPYELAANQSTRFAESILLKERAETIWASLCPVHS